ncbi:MAG: exodeoxyribonuclease VII large subunit [Bacteroidales bacterium]|nr:exodeoxyribonuclease VII large subunit [Bacteroidales bacterium]MCM1415491.1 exodeoxyribonuclease VII large subunit [bacterium]MCM1423428.1 exodeoxyribonuclease VII large subunit [bacterium]
MQNIYTVAQVNSYIKNMFTQDFMLQKVRIRGEVSNCKYHTSGHIYFTLKDAKSTISCVMFSSDRRGLPFRMEEGQQVVASGTVDVYERDGKYQLYARQIELDGIGALYERYERLKTELAERGMFAEQYKQPIPRYVKRLGVVTAETGAAVRDIINVASRRNPYVQIILYPAIVQGEAAVPSIINGIHAMERQQVDLIIVGRGGGSIEDLWAFNEEAVAQAIFDCPIPVISAVGHETDVTITDFVADLRAPTPSAAAELAVCDFGQLTEQMTEYAYTMRHLCERTIRNCRGRAEQYAVRLKYASPLSMLRMRKTQALSFEEHLQAAMAGRLQTARHRLALYAEQMKGLSPLDKLSQGYAYVSDASGKTVSSVGQVAAGDEISVYVRDGKVAACVTATEERLPEAGRTVDAAEEKQGEAADG